MVSAKDLWSFEEEVAKRFAAGEIKGPVHLNSPSQIEALQTVFQEVAPEDWVLGTWRSHYHALLRGVPREEVLAAVLAGRSMMLHFPAHKFLTSAIVGGILPLACGLAAGGSRVWCFLGDMTATTGLYHEARLLATTRNLPITFIEEDNGLSTNSPTKAAWGLTRKSLAPFTTPTSASAPTTSPSRGAQKVSSLEFHTAVNVAMRRLAQEPTVRFVGQSLKWDGAAIYHSLEGVPMGLREEFPVAENLQLGYCTGLSLQGRLPVCIYPGMDFLLLALDQLVNHLDKLPTFGWSPKVIIRARVGQKEPLDAGPQHTQNHTRAFYSMLETVKVLEVSTAAEVEWAYEQALKYSLSTLIVENPNGK